MWTLTTGGILSYIGTFTTWKVLGYMGKSYGNIYSDQYFDEKTDMAQILDKHPEQTFAMITKELWSKCYYNIHVILKKNISIIIFTNILYILVLCCDDKRSMIQMSVQYLCNIFSQTFTAIFVCWETDMVQILYQHSGWTFCYDYKRGMIQMSIQ